MDWHAVFIILLVISVLLLIDVAALSVIEECNRRMSDDA